ncbi:hypothetical protein AB0I28_20250 [Phytomonospora sp. NPDC050363]|uniref:hypothetical protein n=1 Tax=Phytomonospora sp. NPDC050363 TaxID=3155642 RepID=UPI0033E5C734
MKITLPMTPAKLAVLALLVVYGAATIAVAVILFEPEEMTEKTNLAYVVTPAMSAVMTVAYMFFLRPKSARLDGTTLSVREARRVVNVNLATVVDARIEQTPDSSDRRLDLRPADEEVVSLPLGAAKAPELAALADALAANETAAAKETAARLRMPR